MKGACHSLFISTSRLVLLPLYHSAACDRHARCSSFSALCTLSTVYNDVTSQAALSIAWTLSNLTTSCSFADLVYNLCQALSLGRNCSCVTHQQLCHRGPRVVVAQGGNGTRRCSLGFFHCVGTSLRAVPTFPRLSP